MTEPAPDPTVARFSVTGGIGPLRSAATRVARLAEARGVPASRAADVRLAVHECLVNAHEHGHRGDEAVPVVVEVERDEGMVRVSITDRGLGAAWYPPPPSPVDGVQGRGLVLARDAADQLTVRSDPAATTVDLRFVTARAPGVDTAENG